MILKTKGCYVCIIPALISNIQCAFYIEGGGSNFRTVRLPVRYGTSTTKIIFYKIWWLVMFVLVRVASAKLGVLVLSVLQAARAQLHQYG